MQKSLSISFDLDGTLSDIAFVDGVWNEGLPRLVAQSRNIDLKDAAQICLDAYLREGEASIKWYKLSHWLDHFGVNHVSEEELISGFTSRITMYEDATRAVKRLHGLGFPLVLFSNAPRLFLDKEVRKLSLKDYFDTIISLPDDWGMIKSQGAAFIRLRSQIGNNFIHVGDHVRFDCEVPREVGIKAFHVWRGKGPRLDDSLANLDEFIEKIGLPFKGSCVLF